MKLAFAEFVVELVYVAEFVVGLVYVAELKLVYVVEFVAEFDEKFVAVYLSVGYFVVC